MVSLHGPLQYAWYLPVETLAPVVDESKEVLASPLADFLWGAKPSSSWLLGYFWDFPVSGVGYGLDDRCGVGGTTCSIGASIGDM